MGYGLVGINRKKMCVISLGVIQLHKLNNHPMKLKKIFEKTIALIDEYHPDDLAIESPFFGKNIQSMLKLGRAQGVAMAAALHRTVPIFEYSPKKIKQSITGNGNASKEQVAAMLQRLLAFDKTPHFLDATDGLAAAVCHHFQNNDKGNTGIKNNSNVKSWKAFVNQHPEKISSKPKRF